MRCFEILVNGKRVALVGHADAERLTAEIETNRNIDVAALDLVAEFPVKGPQAT